MARKTHLTQTHLNALNAVLQSVPVALEHAQRCQRCGMDVQQYVDALHAQRQFAEAVKAEHFPDHK